MKTQRFLRLKLLKIVSPIFHLHEILFIRLWQIKNFKKRIYEYSNFRLKSKVFRDPGAWSRGEIKTWADQMIWLDYAEVPAILFTFFEWPSYFHTKKVSDTTTPPFMEKWDMCLKALNPSPPKNPPGLAICSTIALLIHIHT